MLEDRKLARCPDCGAIASVTINTLGFDMFECPKCETQWTLPARR